MNRTIVSLSILLIITSFAIGVERIDVIQLKNGDIVKGIIVENVPNDYIRVELQGGSILTYQYTDIEKFLKETIETKSAPQTQSSPLSDPQKMMMYESQKKNPTTAVALSCFLSSAGHGYAENWGRGLMFTAARAGCVIFAIAAGFENECAYYYTTSYGNSYCSYYDTDVTGFYFVGMIGAGLFAIWEMIDASNEVKKYNQKLYNRVYLGQPSYGMNIIPKKDGANLMLTYNF